MDSAEKPWYLRPVYRWTALRSVPLSRLWSLLVAAFLLFSVIGYYSDLESNGNMPYAVVILIAVYSGLNACLWIYGTSRWPVSFTVALVGLEVLSGTIIDTLSHWIGAHFRLQPVESRQGIHFAATAIFVCIIASYSFFLRFIVAESKRSTRLQSELELAHDIQKTLVPVVHLRTGCFEVYGLSHASERVGGDLVDAVSLNTGTTVAYLADVAGHGLSASILMGRLKTATRTAMLEGATDTAQHQLSVLLGRLNTVLPQVKEPHLYATFTGFCLGADGAITYALAASPPIFLWQAIDRSVSQLGEPQFPLGLLPVSSFDSVSFPSRPGDLLVVATDGILEVANKEGEEFGPGRVQRLLNLHAEMALPALANTILHAVRDFGRQFDDQTLLLIRRV